MPTLLTPKQRNDLQQHGDKPMPVIDPVTHKVYVLLAGDVFERFKALLEDEPFELGEAYAAQSATAGAAGWDDPEMDVYDNYDAHKPQREESTW